MDTRRQTTINDESEPQEDDELNIEQYEIENKMNSNGPNGLSSTSKHHFHLEYNKFLTDRHHRIYALLLFIILILGIILLVIGIKVLIFSLKKNEEICDSSQCLFTSARISHNINWTLNACDNFYKFACGKWIDDNKLNDYQGQYSIKEQIKDQIYLELKHYLDKILFTLPPDDPFVKTKRFYESCMNLEEIDLSSLNYIKSEIVDSGGWNIIGNWHGPSWQHDMTLERLHTYYGVNAFFKITIGADDLDPKLPFIIKIYPAGLGLPRAYYFDPAYKNVVEAYKLYMSEIVKIFVITKFHAGQFAENTFNYEKRIAEITPEQIDYLNPSNMFKRRFSIRELKTIAPSIKWLNLFQKYFQKARLNDNTRVLLAFEYYFRNISNIISTTDSKGLNDYLIWKLISTYAPYLSKDFRIIHYNFQQSLNNLPSLNFINDENRWKFCIETVSKFLDNALSSLYVHNKMATISNNTIEVKNIIGSLQKTILDNYRSFIWTADDDENENQKLINMKLKQMEIFVGQPQFILKSHLNGYYNEFFVGVKFIQNIFEAINHKHKKMEMLLNEKNYDHFWPLPAYDVDIHYDYAANKLFIPAGILNVPYYDIQAPYVTQFGALGFHITSQILRAFDLIGLQYNLPDGRLSNNKKFIENRFLLENTFCLSRHINSISNKLNNTSSQTYIDLGALHFSWLAYKQFQQHSEHSRLPSLNLNNDQLFFISFAQTFCSNIKPKTLEMLYETSDRLPDSIRVNALLSQSKIFSNVFQCSEPVHEICHLWN